ncbi:MAG: hypothetical protein EA348_07625, partial [Pseudomonadaceae bacterium]
MQGQIINFDSRMASGMLRCSKGQEFGFSGREWQGQEAPQPGQRVSFMPIGQHATGVKPLELAQAIPTIQAASPEEATPASQAAGPLA